VWGRSIPPVRGKVWGRLPLFFALLFSFRYSLAYFCRSILPIGHSMKRIYLIIAAAILTGYSCSDKLKDEELLRVDTVPIKKVRVDAAVKNYLEQMGTHNADDSIKIREQIIDGMVKNALLALRAQKEGFVFDSTEVNRFITMFKGQIGSDSLLNKKLKEAGMTFEDWQRDVQEQSMIGKFLKATLDEKITVADSSALDSARKVMKNFEVKASHILLKVTPDAPASEIQKVGIKLEGIEKEIKAAGGKNFAAMAKKYSEDGSAKFGGDLGYFKRGTMVPEFEEVAFSLPKGEVSGILRTQFGLHIIKVEDRRETVVPEESIKKAALNLTKSKAFEKLITELKAEYKILRPEDSK